MTVGNLPARFRLAPLPYASPAKALLVMVLAWENVPRRSTGLRPPTLG
jgi:hypothetical protein